MKTSTVRVAQYKSLQHGYIVTGEVRIYGNDNSQYALISNEVEIDFKIIDDVAAGDALKALKVKAAQARVYEAQAELDAL